MIENTIIQPKTDKWPPFLPLPPPLPPHHSDYQKILDYFLKSYSIEFLNLQSFHPLQLENICNIL